MYKKHKFFLSVIAIFIFILSYILQINYVMIASESITIVSIVLAIYMTSFSNLVSSNLANIMKKKEDIHIKGKSQLGVLKTYLNMAIGIGINNIVIACCVLIFDDKFNWSVISPKLYYIISSVGFSMLGIDIFFMVLLYRFMVNRQL